MKRGELMVISEALGEETFVPKAAGKKNERTGQR
jgi:hypothetical protein